VTISAIAAQSANPTTDTLAQTKQLLDYIATQEDAVITYSVSDMILNVHSDAGYLNESKARSRAGGHFFLSTNKDSPPNNGAIHVMSSATEAELAALYIMAKEAIYVRIILEEMGHTQPPTPMQTDNACAEGVVNSKIQPKRTKAMDMRFIPLATGSTMPRTIPYIGNPVNSIMLTTGPNTTQPNITKMFDPNL
jgi:hypothetical protein